MHESNLLHGSDVTLLTRRGDKIKGSASHGVMRGPVIIEYDNGDFYEGCFRRGMRSGHGLFVSRDGLEYKGEFLKNMYHGYGVLKQDGVVVHEGKFVRGSYGQVGAADEGTSTSGSDEEDRAALTEDEVTLTGVKSSNPKPVAGGTVGIRAAAAAPSSPPFVNPYSLRAAVGDTTLFSSSDSDSFPSSPPSATKVLPTALQPSLKLPALHTLHAQGDVGGGPLLSGYDSWSEDDADAGGGSGTADDDDWSDIENPQQAAPNTHALHKLKLAPVAAFAPLDSASPSDSAAQRVEVWAARHAGGGLLGLMLNMRSALDARLPDADPPLTPQSTAQQVKRAYMSMLLHVHPDKLAEQPQDYVELCSAAFPVLRDAYEAFKSAR